MEEWRVIPNYNGVYYVSNFGRVKSIDHYCKNRIGSGKQTGRILKQHKCYKGYLRVSLSKNKIKKNYSVHRLVAKSFCENPKNKPQVNHIDGIKDNNISGNLEWVTNSENQIHAIKNNLIKHNIGAESHNSKLSKSDVIEILNLRKKNKTLKYIGNIYDISSTSVCNIINNKTYKNIKRC